MADVAVVGAGPAGAWAAYLLARGGARVELFDASHPREKPCGGGVTGRALTIVADAIPVDALPAVHITEARFTGEGVGTSATVALGNGVNGRPLIVASRRHFDGLLLEAARRAGAQFVAARVADVEQGASGVQIRTADGRTHRARWIIGADGANSLVRRRVTQAFRRDQLSIATGFFAHGCTSHAVVIEVTHNPPGYIWSFPRPDHLAIGICAQADAGANAAALRQQTAAWIERTRIGSKGTLEPYSWPIPSLSAADFDNLIVAGRGWMLIGDAAGLVDPLTREGIFFSLRSARSAADALLSTSAVPHRDHSDKVRSEITQELRRAARLKAGFFHRRFTRLLVDALSTSPAIRRVMADMIAGEQGYHGLEWRLVRTLEVGLAWRFLRARRCPRGNPGAPALPIRKG